MESEVSLSRPVYNLSFNGAVVEIGGYICDASARQVQNSEEELVQLTAATGFNLVTFPSKVCKLHIEVP